MFDASTEKCALASSVDCPARITAPKPTMRPSTRKPSPKPTFKQTSKPTPDLGSIQFAGLKVCGQDFSDAVKNCLVNSRCETNVGGPTSCGISSKCFTVPYSLCPVRRPSLKPTKVKPTRKPVTPKRTRKPSPRPVLLPATEPEPTTCDCDCQEKKDSEVWINSLSFISLYLVVSDPHFISTILP